MSIHPTVIVHPTAKFSDGVNIEPYAVIGEDVVIEQDVKIGSGAKLEFCHIGEGTQISSHAIIGTPPQDLGYKGQKTGVVVGKNCQIREFVTINRSAKNDGDKTIVGDNCLLMTSAHVAHDCKLGNNVILANLVTLAGHVEIGDYSFIGGTVVIHQFVKVGEMVIMGGFSGTRQDIPPFAKTDGRPAGIIGINTIGLRRRGLNQQQRTELKKAFNYIWFSDMNNKQAIEKIQEETHGNEYVDRLINFIQTSKRGVTKLHGKQEMEND